jgi:hypothetical protein
VVKAGAGQLSTTHEGPPPAVWGLGLDSLCLGSPPRLAASSFPDFATHAIDFGLGGLSGIGPLTARNFDGRGVRVVVVGDHGRGDNELYDALDVKYEEWWRKKWAPKLVRTR